MTKRASCHIGTSGWHYKHWKGPFYPEDFSEREFLDFYSKRFSAVEINNSFYQLPDPGTLRQWHRTVHGDFIFAVKASRYITHMKKLKDPRKSLSNFLKVIDTLKDKLGPVLFQLPPRWHINAERLESFLNQLPREYPCAFEFRDSSWFDEKIYQVLTDYNAAFCVYELAGHRSPERVTSDYVYIRLHGPKAAAYEGSYSKQCLNTWADKIRKWMKDGREVYCFFDNDQYGYAAKNAAALREILNS